VVKSELVRPVGLFEARIDMRVKVAVVRALVVALPLSLLPVMIHGQRGDKPGLVHLPPEQSKDEANVLALDQAIANAVVRGDTAYVDSVTAADFVMVHGDGWTIGGKPRSTDTKQSMLARVTNKAYDVLDFDSVKAEMHGDIAITYGRYLAHMPGSARDQAWFSVWYERVYAKRNDKWIYLSHRTVHGPTFGPDRASVKDK
jgi:ketosteroid isomerase-like protein